MITLLIEHLYTYSMYYSIVYFLHLLRFLIGYYLRFTGAICAEIYRRGQMKIAVKEYCHDKQGRNVGN